MTAADASALLDVLIVKAPGLRAAGVLALELGEVKVQLMPPDGALPDMAKSAPISGDPLKDHALYGLPPGATLPGFGEPDDSDLLK